LDPEETHPLHRVAVVALILLCVSTQLTAVQRLMHLLMALDEVLKRSFFRSHGGTWRSLISSFIATVADFFVMVTLVSQGILSPALATLVGCVFGACINFVLKRQLIVGSPGKTSQQIYRYAFVAVTSALLNAGGVTIMLLIPSIVYWMGWPLVRTAVFLTWNFPLQRDYVFVAPAK